MFIKLMFVKPALRLRPRFGKGTTSVVPYAVAKGSRFSA
jgi:hypothetical protein